jgi:aflatoxin B1 aldehyde reductase
VDVRKHNTISQDRFWKPEYFAAVDTIRAACEEAGGGLTASAAALRWLYSHSGLDGAKGDGVILGASSAAHLEENLAAAAAAARGELLPAGVLEAGLVLGSSKFRVCQAIRLG